MPVAVELDRVTYRYPGGKAGIFDLTLQLQQGELVVCIGPSGCGKTTLLKLIAGFFRPESGVVRLGGQDMTHTSVASRGCGIVFQSYALFPHMRVWENVAYPLRVRGIDVAQRRRRADEMLEMVGLAGMAERLPAQLSGGQQQRVALARALAFEPKALLLDEPLSALDAATRVAMRDEVRRIQKMQNIAALLITHDQDEALSLADRIAVLKDGRLVQCDTPAAIYDRPVDGFVAGFVGRANVLEGRAAGPEHGDFALGRLRTPPHGLRDGAPLKALIRPERLEPLADGAGDDTNVFEVRVLKDRFFGATRQLDLSIGEAVLKLETTSRAALSRVRIPVAAVQFLSNP
ncbi:ABC transporter ATP-binding protein [Azohydromonas sp.]|uniref:ABC transporter ATP-binding protein n=1 Tax=Azohydromonas sp. TaxID=1872666 RepID=UPI002BFDCFB0|nr:ABC transporter ATP-binding protein [Azohydromonas sp.]HMM84562.1 ABC transporter ATP-binding protein [Azohydromonas sp.]